MRSPPIAASSLFTGTSRAPAWLAYSWTMPTDSDRSSAIDRVRV